MIPNWLYQSLPYILKGIPVTLELTAVAALLGFFLGTLLTLCKISHFKVLKGTADFYTSIFRGTPLILQLFIIYFATPQLTGYDITGFQAGALAFGLNSAAYMSEIIRAGISAVDKGQFEAAEALGVPYKLMMKDIILPQAIKNILPAIMNEFITLTKESAIISTIGVLDIMRRSDEVVAQHYVAFPPLIVALIIYYILVMILTFIGRKIERRLRVSD